MNSENEVLKNIPKEYEPISMWGYFGYQLLFAIPLVGFILAIVFSFGGTQNINLRNFARSYFCAIIIVIILSILLFTILGVGIGTYIYNAAASAALN